VTLALLGQLLGIAAASGTRASLTVLLVALVARFGDTGLPGELAFLSSNVGLALLAALVVLDEVVDRDPELQELLSLTNVGVRGAAGAVSAWGIDGMMGDTTPDAVTWLVGAGIAIGVHLVRVRALQYVPEGTKGFGPRTWVAWLEAGGVFGLIAAVFLAPLLALAFAVLATLGGVTVLLVARSIEHTRHRRPCPHCRTPIRKEASRCRSCGNPVSIERRLSL